MSITTSAAGINCITDSFHELNCCLTKLEEYLCSLDAKLPVWFDCPFELKVANYNLRKQIYFFLKRLEYLDSQEPRSILLGPGIVAASDTTIALVHAVNAAKQEFKQAILAIKKSSNAISNNQLQKHLDNLLNKRSNTVASNLTKLGLARLHLKQCYRLIPILEARPEKISWTWANTKAITKISKAQALIKLQRQRCDPAIIAMQVAKLEQISNNESLAIVQELAPHLRANIVFAKGNKVERLMIKGAMPIFYPASSNLPLPKFKPPKSKQDHSDRQQRNDLKLEATAFLPSIRAYRYAHCR